MNRGMNRLNAAEALDRIINDSDSGSEFEMSDEESSQDSSAQSSSDDDVRPGSNNTNQIQRGRRTVSRGRGRIRTGSRGRGRGCRVPSTNGRGGRRGRGRPTANGNASDTSVRSVNSPIPNIQGPNCYDWEFMNPLDDFDTDWLPEPAQRRGVLVNTDDFNPVDYFYLFFPRNLFETIVTHTNLYAEQHINSLGELPQYSRYKSWVPTSVAEMKAFVALQIAMGLNNKPELEDYWGTFWLTKNSFSDVMSRNRYELLCAFLHFNDNAERAGRNEPGYDPLYKVRTVLDIVDPLYPQVFSPGKSLSIDESMIKFKGRIFFRQYLPAKPTKWGIKAFALCDSDTGYGLRFVIYTGKSTFQLDQNSPLSMTEQVALEMVRGYDNKGYIIYMDNYYSSPKLFSALKDRGIGACGTVNPRRKFMPTTIQPNNFAIAKGEDPVFMRCENLLTCAMMDTKRVHFLSSIHNDNTFVKRVRDRKSDTGFRTIEKPVMSEHYNMNMNGVDVLDQKLGSYSYPHKSSKWYMTIYHRVKEIALVNGYIVYLKSIQGNQKPIATRLFRERVIDGLLEGFPLRASKKGRPFSSEKPDRLTGRHFSARYEDNNFRPECTVCSDRKIPGWKRVQTRNYCVECDKAMCPVDCFRIYHTYKDYRASAATLIYKL